MAERKPLFISTEGFPQEMATSDSMQLGGLTMSGDIDMNSAGYIGNINAATASGDVLTYGQTGAELSTSLTISGTVSNDTHAATKEYVDTQMVTGGSIREPILTNGQLSATQGIRAAVALTLQSNATDDDRVVITDGTTTRTYYFGTGTGDVQVTIGGTAAISMTNLAAAIHGDGSGNWLCYFSSTGLSSIDDGGVCAIFENVTSGAAPKIYGTNWGAGECQIVDFGGETDYLKKTLTDIPSSEPGSTNFGFRRTVANLTNGEMHAALRETDNTLMYWDDDGNTWQSFSGTSSIVDATAASGGGTKGKVTFDSDYGLSVSSGVAEVVFDTNPALEFSGGGALQIKIFTPHQLTLDANGISMAGVGAQFKINGVSNHANVTAANLDDLTDGSNADALHVHTATSVTLNHSDVNNVTANQHHDQSHGIQTVANHTESGLTTGHVLTATGATTFAWQAPAEATAAEAIENTYTTATDTTANGDPIYVNGNDTIGKARADTDSKARILGVIRTGGGAAPASVEIVSAGPCEGVLSGATVNTPYFLGDSGGLSTSLPTTGNRVICLGYAMNATDLYVRMHDYGKSAP